MAKYSIEDTTLTGIADAIREKAGTTGEIDTSQMAESILAIKGGLSLDVVTASALPDTVVDGQIVVITETTAGTVYIDTDEPESPAVSDLWIKLEAGADVLLELTEESPYLGGGLTEANQWNGSEWGMCDGYLGNAGNWEQFSMELPPVGTVLNDMTWEQISIISRKGLAKKYFSVGDAKQITINGTVGVTALDKSVWAFIIGFDHNSGYEGGNTIHFQICKSAQAGGINLAFVDSRIGGTVSSANGYFCINSANTNAGGWEGSAMRMAILGNGGSPSAPTSGSLMAAIGEDLRSVMRSVTKYTDNVGYPNAAANVTATEDYMWLLSEYEVFGVRKKANSTEVNYQKQYEYYSSGNDKLFYRHNSTGTAVVWWLRSVSAGSSNAFCTVSNAGAVADFYSTYSFGLAPCFCV